MGAAMRAAREAADPDDKINVYKGQLDQLAQVREAYNNAAMASGAWHVQTVKNISASEDFTNKVRKQKLTIGELTRAYKEYRKTGGGALGEAIKEQVALRNATATQLTSSVFGKNLTDLHLPKNLGSELDNARVKLGMISKSIQAASNQMINWGKNTQWAGRQITVGLTVPIGMAAVGVAALAMKVDEQLTRIAKVYDTTAQNGAAQERELGAVREESLATATRLAHTYGAAMEETLDVQAQLAATGLTGPQLQQATSEVVRIATLGEMDYNDAIQMTISLQTAFKLSNEDLTETFNMFNAVENATSLSIQDIAQAIPRAASAMAAMGGSAKDLTVLMAALKESGVDPAIGANAIKSATATLLTPTQEAIKYFQETLHIDLPGTVREANGNILALLTNLGQKMEDLDPTKRQAGIAQLFGKYQFDRATALLTNLGDAASGMSNQTAKAMDIVGMSAAELAGMADTEIERMQKSASGRFHIAVESMKAELIPLGETVLGAVTPIIDAITFLIEKFNNLGDVSKTVILGGAAFLAISGPLLMIVGIFANMFGQITRVGAVLANLRIRFRALSADEAASEIMARKATSSFDTEGSAVARLTMQVEALTNAMRESAIASGAMMDSTGRIGQRTVVKPKHGAAYYGAGSVNAAGQRVDQMPVTAADAAMYAQMAGSAKEIDDTTEKTKGRWSNIGGIMRNAGMVGIAAFGMMGIQADGIGGTMLDVAMVLMMLQGTGLMSGMIKKAKEFAGIIRGAFAQGGAMSGVMEAAGGLFSKGGLGRLGGSLAGVGRSLLGIAGTALRVFGPIGILAAGAWIVSKIVEDFQQAEEHQKALASSGKAWADALGYTYTPGQLPGMDEKQVSTANKVVEAQKAMEESTEGLGDAMKAAAEDGNSFQAAMQQALQVVTTGGTVDQARIAFEAALKMGNVDKAEINRLLIRFDKIELDDPHAVRQALAEQLSTAMDGVNMMNVEVQNTTDSVWDSITGFFREGFGGDLSSEARAAGTRVGAALAEGLANAASPEEQSALFSDLTNQMNQTFAGLYSEAMSDPEVASAADALGIDSADRFIQQMNKIKQMVENDETLSDTQQAFWDSLTGGDDVVNVNFNDFERSYEEMIDTIVQGMVDSGKITQDEADGIREKIASIADLKVQEGLEDVNPEPLLSVAKATQMWAEQSGYAASSGQNLSEAEKLAALNALRARAGLGEAKTSAQGFGDVINSATGEVDEFAAALSNIEITPEQRLSQLQETFSGTMGDIYGEADRRLQESQNNQLDAIRQGSDDRLAAIEREGKGIDAEFDRRDKELEKRQRAEEKAFESGWDAREKREEARFDSQIDRIQAQIDAEEKADEEREKLFEREKTRIERLAELQNNNIDFNAALNTGNLDEAARLFNTSQATTEQWSLDDQEAALGDASKARREGMEAQIDRLKTAKDARLEALKAEREAETEAFNDRQREAQERLDTEKKNAQEALNFRKETERQATEDAVNNAQKRFDADRRELAGRLRELQAFVPKNETELNQHIGRVEALYRDYGIDLKAQGRGWAGYIGTSLSQNMKTATAKLQNEINWQAMGKVISDRLTDGLGLTAGSMEFFIRNGRFPRTGLITQLLDKALAISQGINLARHAGGEIGGPGFSQRDRAGVPRSASPFPSEYTTLLKRGEFVVNKNSAGRNLGLLQAINSGGFDVGGPGGMSNVGPTALAGHTALFAETVGAGLVQKVIEYATSMGAGASFLGGAVDNEALAGAGMFGAAAGGGGQIQRMFNTIRQHFPRARLNDGYRPGANDMHGRGKAIDLGLQGVPGGAGNSYMAAMNQWIHDNIPNVYELIYDGLGDNRPDLKRGAPMNYGAALQAQHRNHVHWAMQAFHRGGLNSLVPQLKAGGFALSEGLANLHPGEAVLNKPLTDEFRQNVANNGYNVNINLNGPVNTQIDFERGVEKALSKIESRKGRRRVVSG